MEAGAAPLPAWLGGYWSRESESGQEGGGQGEVAFNPPA